MLSVFNLSQPKNLNPCEQPIRTTHTAHTHHLIWETYRLVPFNSATWKSYSTHYIHQESRWPGAIIIMIYSSSTNPPPNLRMHHDLSLRIQICPKKWMNPTILLWGWDWDHQTYSREGYGSLGCVFLDNPKLCPPTFDILFNCRRYTHRKWGLCQWLLKSLGFNDFIRINFNPQKLPDSWNKSMVLLIRSFLFRGQLPCFFSLVPTKKL